MLWRKEPKVVMITRWTLGRVLLLLDWSEETSLEKWQVRCEEGGKS